MAHIRPPETFAIETHIPIAQIIVHKTINQTACFRRVISIQFARNIRNQRFCFRNNPAVYFGTLCQSNLLGFNVKRIYISIECKKAIGVIKRTKKLSAHFVHTIGIEFEVIPRL